MFFSRKPQGSGVQRSVHHPLDFVDTVPDVRLLDMDGFGDGWLGVESTHPLTWVPGTTRRLDAAQAVPPTVKPSMRSVG